MHLSMLGIDIILSNVVPLLAEDDLFALTVVDWQMHNQLGHLRFKTTEVAKNQGFIVDYLEPATLDTIENLTLNGDGVQNHAVFGSTYFKNVTSATLVTPLTARQKLPFSLFVRRLTYFTETSGGEEDDEPVTSLAGLPKGTFNRLHTLCLKLTLPTSFGNLFLYISPALRTITFLPDTHIVDLETYQDYADELKPLLQLCSKKSVLPALHLLHIHPGGSSNSTRKPIRAKILEGVWRAAASHGGWKLLADKPDGGPAVQYPEAHEIFWTHKHWEFSMSSSEFEDFKVCCGTLGIYPRLEDFIAGKVNIHVTEAPEPEALMKTCIDGLNVEINESTSLQEALKVINRHTTAVSIKLDQCWGSVSSTIYSPDHFHQVKAMRIQSPDSPESQASRLYKTNISLSLASSLCIADWKNLVNLSLPAHTFQTLPLVEAGSAVPNYAACGTDVGGYDLTWLSLCNSLQAMQFTDFAACDRCELADEVSFVNGLEHLPESVEFVLVSGHYRCPDRRSMHCRTVVEEGITNVLLAKRADIVVSLRRLRVGIF